MSPFTKYSIAGLFALLLFGALYNSASQDGSGEIGGYAAESKAGLCRYHYQQNKATPEHPIPDECK